MDSVTIKRRGISIHAPTGGATMRGAWSWKRRLIFQSTLPRGERRSVRFRSPFSIRISIHAPTGGATEKGLIDAIMFEISIHAPTGGATGCRRFRDSGSYYFNPRSHGGSDGRGRVTVLFYWRFQSTLPRGERRPLNFIVLLIKKGFQSTLPRGERLFPLLPD